MMADEGATKDPGGQQPEAFPGLDAAAKAGGMKPADQTNRAIPESAPKDASLEKQESDAAGILNRNAQRDAGKS
jgi:hypothetical protein